MRLAKSPYEALLEQENANLKRELEYHQQRNDWAGKQFVPTFADAIVSTMKMETDTLRIALDAGIKQGDWHYHAFVREPRGINVKYVISEAALLTKGDRINVAEFALSDVMTRFVSML